MSTTTPPPPEPGFRDVLARSVRAHWGLYLAEGIVLVLLGLLAIAVPLLAGLAAAIFIGWLLFISGIVGLVSSFGARHAPGFWWGLLSSALALIAGLVLVWNPVQGVLTLTLVLIAYFLIDGIATIMWAVEHRRQAAGSWGWALASGIVDIVLAVMLLLGLPGTAAWALGLIVGIDLVFAGASLAALALSARKAGPDAAPTDQAAGGSARPVS